MADAIDVAEYFLLKHEDPDIANTEEGCEKLQNLMGLANMISIAKYGKPLFDEPVLAEEPETGSKDKLRELEEKIKNSPVSDDNVLGHYDPETGHYILPAEEDDESWNDI